MIRPALSLFLMSVIVPANADERVADVAGYANAMWFAEAFNRLCPDTPMDIPVNEARLRELMITVDGRNLVDEFDEFPLDPSSSTSEQQEWLAREATAEGCTSENAIMLREHVQKALELPELLAELLEHEEQLDAEQ